MLTILGSNSQLLGKSDLSISISRYGLKLGYLSDEILGISEELPMWFLPWTLTRSVQNAPCAPLLENVSLESFSKGAELLQSLLQFEGPALESWLHNYRPIEELSLPGSRFAKEWIQRQELQRWWKHEPKWSEHGPHAWLRSELGSWTIHVIFEMEEGSPCEPKGLVIEVMTFGHQEEMNSVGACKCPFLFGQRELLLISDQGDFWA